MSGELTELRYAPTKPLRRGRWLVTLALVLGLPASAYVGLILAGPLAEFLAWHGLFRWATSLGDIGEKLMLGLGGILAGLVGWVFGILAPVRTPARFRRRALFAAGIPTLLMLLVALSLASRGSFAAAALGCLCMAFSTPALAGALLRGGVERLRDRLSPPDSHDRRKLPYILLALPVISVAGGLGGLHVLHMREVARREPACVAYLESVIAAQAKYYETHRTPVMINQVLDDPIAGQLVTQRLDGYSVRTEGTELMLVPESIAPYSPFYWRRYNGRSCTIYRGVCKIGSNKMEEEAITTMATR